MSLLSLTAVLLIICSIIVPPDGCYGKVNIETQMSALNRLMKNKYYQSETVYSSANQIKMADDGISDDEEDDLDGFNSESQLKENDKIEKLPGQPAVKFNQFGGYVTVERKSGRALYYYFVEAEEVKPESAPLLLWLNGGPGCSSLAYGAMLELGPFRVNSDGKTLYKNKYAWNRGANVLFVESPAGVGFSYSNTTSDYQRSGDRMTARDNLVFLLNWMERFPEYKGREFFIAGESYAGHYVPQLARAIIDNNRKGNNITINLKGIMIGNGLLNDETDMKGMYDYMWSHALISDEVRDAIINHHCNFSAITQTNICQEAYQQVAQDIRDIDIYNIYAPTCQNSDLSKTNNTKHHLHPPGDVIDPCSEDFVLSYFNTPEVQKAMHANVTGLLHYQWETCSNLTRWNDSPSTVLPLLRDFSNANVNANIANANANASAPIRILIFSGDTDGIVPVTSTRYSIRAMKLPIITKWYPWYSDDGEVGGYTQIYQGNLTFGTIRGAGHQVPSYQPARALIMFNHFLKGTPLPRN